MVKRGKVSSEESYKYMLDMILNKQLMPGERIPELKIAEQLGVSRTPVRDAMKKLENDGLIELFPNRFAQVKNYTLEEIQDLGTVRVALDTLAVRLASLQGSQLDYMNLMKLAEECEAASVKGDILVRTQKDCDFHLAVTKISKNESLQKIQTGLYLCIQFIIIHHPNHVEDEKRHLNQHYELIKAMSENRVKDAIQIIRDHLSSFYGLKNNYPPGFFEDEDVINQMI